MTTQFQPNTVVFGDEAGLGAWLVGHYRQHLAYNSFLASKSPPVVIATHDILTVIGGQLGQRFWLDEHEKWHEAVRPLANVTGINLSEVDLSNQAAFYQWIDVHNQEHAAIDVAFGLA